MGWEVRETKIANHFEFFRDKKGNFIGYVIKFALVDVTHAWTAQRRLGQAKNIGMAKDLVEEMLP